MKITAVIPIRKGSQRVPNKNLRPFGDTTLLEWKIATLLQVPQIHEIIVNTDSEEALRIVNQRYNAELRGGGEKPHVRGVRREAYYASSACSGSEFFRHLGEVTETDIFLYTPCTSPFITAKTLSTCIQQFLDVEAEFDCVSTVSAVKEFLWLDGAAINYDPAHAPNSQNLPNIVALNFGVTVTRRETLIANSNIIGKRPLFVQTDDTEAIDIDTPLDFYIAEQLYRKLYIEQRALLE